MKNNVKMKILELNVELTFAKKSIKIRRQVNFF